MFTEKQLNRSRFLYILEASFEYLISILVASSFLATLTKQLGISDSLTGIISSFISLGCLFQLFSLTLHKKQYKSVVTVMSILNQLLFMFLYVIPIIPLQKNIKIAVFVATIFLAYFIYNFVHPKKINWFMSLIDDKKRGRFTAVKEMVSLIIGMVFTFGMGAVVDYYKAAGKIRSAFIISAAVIFVLMIMHTLTMVFSVEKEPETVVEKNIWNGISKVLKDKNVLKVTLVFVLWQIASYVTIPFYGTYQISELGFSLKFVSALNIVSSIIRVLSSYFLGSYADRHSFLKMMRICFAVVIFGFAFSAFSAPGIGKYLFIGYYVCHGFAMGGINSALINLVYDYVPTEKRADSLALSQAISGVFGFLATLVMSPLVAHIQNNGNTFLGFNLYAQQVTSVIAILLTALVFLYIVFVPFQNEKKN